MSRDLKLIDVYAISTGAMFSSGLFLLPGIAVLSRGHDLVILGADESDGTLDSFAQHILRKCPCPVWAVRFERPARLVKIVATVAAEPDDVGHEAMDAMVLQIAGGLAVHERAQLHVLHAWIMPGEDLHHRHGASNDEIAEMQRDWRNSSRHALRGALQRHGVGENTEVHLLEGEADEVIRQFADENDVDLIIMGTAGRAGVAGLFIGNTAEDVMQGVRCAVLAVKPEGFVTPIQLD